MAASAPEEVLNQSNKIKLDFHAINIYHPVYFRDTKKIFFRNNSQNIGKYILKILGYFLYNKV